MVSTTITSLTINNYISGKIGNGSDGSYDPIQFKLMK